LARSYLKKKKKKTKTKTIQCKPTTKAENRPDFRWQFGLAIAAHVLVALKVLKEVNTHMYIGLLARLARGLSLQL